MLTVAHKSRQVFGPEEKKRKYVDKLTMCSYLYGFLDIIHNWMFNMSLSLALSTRLASEGRDTTLIFPVLDLKLSGSSIFHTSCLRSTSLPAYLSPSLILFVPCESPLSPLALLFSSPLCETITGSTAPSLPSPCITIRRHASWELLHTPLCFD